MKSNTPDYLKYWRVIRYYIKARYGLSQAELDMLLFLNSERYFGKEKFDEFDSLLGWDKKRFKAMMDGGWIELFRKGYTRTRNIYQLSFKAKAVIEEIYKKLEGKDIPISDGVNPMFAKKVGFNDKVYRHMILKMRDEVRRLKQRPPL